MRRTERPMCRKIVSCAELSRPSMLQARLQRPPIRDELRQPWSSKLSRDLRSSARGGIHDGLSQRSQVCGQTLAWLLGLIQERSC